MAARDSLRQLFGTPDSIYIPFNLELDQLCSSAVKNLSVNEWSQKKVSARPTHFELGLNKTLGRN